MQTPQNDFATLAQKATQQLADRAEAAQPFLAAMAATLQGMARHPHQPMQDALTLYQQHLALGAGMLGHMLGQPSEPVVQEAKGDRRFSHPMWQQPPYNALKQSYLLTSNMLTKTVEDAAAKLDPHTAAQATFFTRLVVEALCPANNPATNPEALATALETNGQSLVQGLQNWLTDLQNGRISMTDYDAFQVGKTIATTPGNVVFQNRLIQLIQYAPQTEKVHPIPLIICPPWINRFYILELSPHNSLAGWLVQQGFQVFMISWKNPTEAEADVTFEDYLQEGFVAASDAAMSITGQSKVNAMGYCIGGAMLACATAILNAKGDARVNSATFLATLTDYANPGEVGIFIDEAQVQKLEQKMAQNGTMDGRDMAATWSHLRSTDLIWNYVTNNYLLGKQPAPFDILYWNDDSTRLPAAMHSWYLRNFYLENNIGKPGKLTLLGTPLDITNLTQPLYMMAGATDHITPWESCYAPFARMKSPSKRFILSTSGHVAGVVNPPTPEGKPVKKQLLAGEATAPTGKTWQATAQTVPDSWWPDYAAWLKPLAGDPVKAPVKLGNATYKPLQPAPGNYVLEQ
ncbi:MAG: class I poly(R)-hydroxyalkanoic acid synthase [Pseudomonadaceae bacterium]|nr:class I poly(R)-hydroxyalkanoic acid synthase [Pseudomonadaceae bacterium]